MFVRRQAAKTGKYCHTYQARTTTKDCLKEVGMLLQNSARHTKLDHTGALGTIGRLLYERLSRRRELNDEVAVGDNSDLKGAAGDWSRGCGCAGGRFHGGCEIVCVRCKGVWVDAVWFLGDGRSR